MSIAALSDPDWWYLDSRAPREPASTAEIIWLAALYEGEGHVDRSHLKITQKDRWVLDRCRTYFGGRVWTRHRIQDDVATEISEWYVTGPRSRGVAMTIYKFLSPRRQRQIRDFLNVPRDGDDPEWTEALRRIAAKLDAKR